MKRGWWIAAALCAAIMAGCGGGGGSTAGGGAPSVATNASQRGTATFLIKIPSAATLAALRRPQYVSPATMSIAISVDGGTPTVASLTPTSPNCSSVAPSPAATGSSSYTTCTVTTSVLAGTHSFVLTTYDKTAATGNVLSTATLTGTVIAGIANSFPVTLGGVVAGIVLSLSQPQPPIGTSATITLTVAAQDADGYTILSSPSSPYVTATGATQTITLADSDTTGATALSTTSLTNSGQTVTVLYSGAVISSAVFSATASGVPSSAIKSATLVPGGAVASGGAVAIAVVTIGATTYAFVPSTNGLAKVTVANSGAILSSKRRVLSLDGTTGPPPGLDQQQLEAWWAAYLKSAAANSVPAGATPNPSSTPTMAPAPVVTSSPSAPVPNECAANTTSTGATLYCINYTDSLGRIQLYNVNSTGVASYGGAYTTDAAGSISYSGGSCYICGVVLDQTDNAIIIATKNGYELYALGTNLRIKTIPANVSENFGYDVATNQIWSPQYSGSPFSLDLIGVSTSTLYSFATPAPTTAPSPSGSPTATPLPYFVRAPDQGSVDPSTGIAVAPEEFTTCCIAGSSYFPLYMFSLPNAQLAAPSPGPTGSGRFPGQQYFSDAAFTEVGILNNVPGASWQISDTAIDSPDHLLFFAAEFAAGAIGVAQLPTAPTTTPQLGDYTFATLPSMPNGSTFYVPGDPHAVTTATIGSKNYALVFDSSLSYVVVIDLKALLLAPRSGTDPHLVLSTYDLQANNVIYYVRIR